MIIKSFSASWVVWLETNVFIIDVRCDNSITYVCFSKYAKKRGLSEEWELEETEDHPEQTDGNSCGVLAWEVNI